MQFVAGDNVILDVSIGIVFESTDLLNNVGNAFQGNSLIVDIEDFPDLTCECAVFDTVVLGLDN